MADIVVGILALIVGAVFCFRGLAAMRVVIALWGAFAGFALGAGVVASATGEEFLDTGWGWAVGIAVGIVFLLLAYLYYAVAVIITMAAVGFAIGAAAMVAAGAEWNWVVILIGVLLGLLLAAVALAVSLPAILLVVVSVLSGAVTIVGGVLLLTGTLDTADFHQAAITAAIDDDWWWFVLYAALVVLGGIAQARAFSRSPATREQWRSRRP
ncbi:DUF4203 domain-containing protein [Tomitella fengzijianii]|uniref:DUF4203 domain-containing protein n=1 Tax=Tomitella fengzijianii TaxID=2597660 RepID=A0A516X3G7_9ACTN|nr:DUF4203 domain-containing protein [Tomitella fengzijianii]QDQ97619.1 DUF4203 domain-containing protein [Tomitella fengzijianii]